MRGFNKRAEYQQPLPFNRGNDLRMANILLFTFLIFYNEFVLSRTIFSFLDCSFPYLKMSDIPTTPLHSYTPYQPNKVLPIVFAVLIALSLLTHAFQNLSVT